MTCPRRAAKRRALLLSAYSPTLSALPHRRIASSSRWWGGTELASAPFLQLGFSLAGWRESSALCRCSVPGRVGSQEGVFGLDTEIGGLLFPFLLFLLASPLVIPVLVGTRSVCV